MSDWTDFLDVAANLATGGLYGVGEAIFNTGQVSKDLGVEAGKIAAEINLGVHQLFESVNSSMSEMSETARNVHELFKLARPDGRAVGEMTEEEARRLTTLVKYQDQLKLELDARAKNVDNNAPLIKADPLRTDEEKRIALTSLFDAYVTTAAKLNIITRLIGQMRYEEPGPIPQTAEHIEEIAERIETLELPRVETILDETADNLAETRGLVSDVRRLLWIPVRSQKPDLTPADQAAIARLQHSAQAYGNLLEQSLQIHPRFSGLTTGVSGVPADAGLASPGGTLPATGPDAAVEIEKSVTTLLKEQNWHSGRAVFLQREQERAQKAAIELSFETSLQPGVIPQTIDSVRQGLDHFREVEQPLADTLITSLNQAVLEAQATLHEAGVSIAQARTSMAAVQSILGSRRIRFGAIACTGLFGLILLFSAVALFRVAFGV